VAGCDELLFDSCYDELKFWLLLSVQLRFSATVVVTQGHFSVYSSVK